jgi:hypothetical protein
MSISKRVERAEYKLICACMPKAAAKEPTIRVVALRTLPEQSNNPTQRRSVYYV